jgi:uncharacterized membrane protein (DUF2068 family)
VTSRGDEARDVGTRVIVVYKAAKAAAQLALAVAIVVLSRRGELETARAIAEGMREHVASRWSASLAHLLAAALTRRGLALIETGLLLDAVLSGFEGWSLWRGYRWGPWLVVCATTVPLPWELWEVARHWSAARLAIGAANLAVVAYLIRRILRRRHAIVPG